MRVRRLQWDGFRIPLRAAFATSHGSITYREGLVLWLTTDTGMVGVGEISPTPAFNGTNLDQALTDLNRVASEIIGRSVEDLPRDLLVLGKWGPLVPAVRCGLDVAAYDVVARKVRISVAELLAGHFERVVPVNATVAAANRQSAVARARSAVTDGFRCVKLKVGLAATIDEEVARVAAVREAIGPETRLRLDANGAWEVNRATATIQAVEHLDLEIIEQPVAASDIAGLAQVRRATRIPLAADEAVTGIARAREILDLDAADALVVKPMVVGGLGPAREIIRQARLAGRRVIVTTTIDSGIGAAAALHLAATLPRPLLASGIATGRLLAGDLLAAPLPVDAGSMAVPSLPGLGVQVDPNALRRFDSGIHGEAGG